MKIKYIEKFYKLIKKIREAEDDIECINNDNKHECNYQYLVEQYDLKPDIINIISAKLIDMEQEFNLLIEDYIKTIDKD